VENFQYKNPTKILFGKGQIACMAREVPGGAKIMLTFGGGSIRRNGVYQQVRAALGNRAVIDFGGIEPNPDHATLMRAVEAARSERVDFLLAVGGGSVLDGTKFIAAAIPYPGDPWDFVREGGRGLHSAVPLATVLTLPATGSESNTNAVISRRETGEKLAFSSPLVYPQFAVLDPETTYSLPPAQVANGIVDAFVHTFEQYMTYPVQAVLQDRLAEGILMTLIEVGPRTLAEPLDYQGRANFMWAATMALNGLIGNGVPQDWATHMIGHELTALYGIDHARTLAAILPHLLRVQSKGKGEKLLQYGKRVWGLTESTSSERIEAAIAKTETFFESLGIPTRLSAYHAAPDTPALVAARLAQRQALPLGERGDIDAEKVKEILTASLGR
jgi:NADP-dependent alcohol dehydrogenase